MVAAEEQLFGKADNMTKSKMSASHRSPTLCRENLDENEKPHRGHQVRSLLLQFDEGFLRALLGIGGCGGGGGGGPVSLTITTEWIVLILGFVILLLLLLLSLSMDCRSSGGDGRSRGGRGHWPLLLSVVETRVDAEAITADVQQHDDEQQ